MVTVRFPSTMGLKRTIRRIRKIEKSAPPDPKSVTELQRDTR